MLRWKEMLFSSAFHPLHAFGGTYKDKQGLHLLVSAAFSELVGFSRCYLACLCWLVLLHGGLRVLGWRGAIEDSNLETEETKALREGAISTAHITASRQDSGTHVRDVRGEVKWQHL